MCAMGGSGYGGSGAMIRQATFLEELCEIGHFNNSLLTGYVVRLRGHQVLKQEQVETAMGLLRKQAPCLRCSFGENAGHVWLQEATEDYIDLEMVQHDAVDEVLETLSRYRYKSRTGPLWCVKVLVSSYPPTSAPMASGETGSRPDTGLGTSSPENEDPRDLPPRPDTGFGGQAGDRYQCRPLLPGEIIAVPLGLDQPNRCVILPPVPPPPYPGPEVPYDPILGAPYHPPPEYGAVAAGAYGGPQNEVEEEEEDDDGEEEAYGSGGSGPMSARVSPENMVEDMDQYRPERPLPQDPAAELPPSRPPSNPSFAVPAPVAPRSEPAASTSSAGVAEEEPKDEELRYRLEEFATEEEREGAAAATAAATAVAPKEVCSARSSMIDTSNSGSPAFLDTGSSSLSSSPRRGPSPLSASLPVCGGGSAITTLVIGIHQGLADGVTAMKICGRFVKLLNDVVMDEHSEDSVPLEENEESIYRALLNPRLMLLSDQETREKVKAQLHAMNSWESCMGAVFGEPAGGGRARPGRRQRHRNKHEVISLDAATTMRLLDKCDAEGVSLQAAFTALANISLMDVLTARDIIKDTYNFYSSHAINLRQFVGDYSESNPAMGCLFAPVHISTRTPRHAADNFWDFVRIIESDLKMTEENDEAIMELGIMELEPLNENEFDRLFNEPLPQMKDFFVYYMGNVSALVSDGGPNLMVEYVECTMSRHKLGYACCHVLHLFHDSLCITMNYSSRYLNHELGKEYMSNLYRRLAEMT